MRTGIFGVSLSYPDLENNEKRGGSNYQFRVEISLEI